MLKINVTQLLGEEAVRGQSAGKGAPTSKAQKVFEDVSRLPRRQQEKIVEVVSALMSPYWQGRQ